MPIWRRVTWTTVASIAAASLIAGCFGNESTAFPPGLEPLDEVTLAPPAPRDGDPFPEELAVMTGGRNGFDLVHARGWVHADVMAIYDCLKIPEVVIDRRSVDRFRVTHDVEPEYDVSFRVRNEVDDVITVEFDVTWRMGVVQGDHEMPSTIAATFSKTWGTAFISLMRGSIVVRQIEPGLSEIELVEHLDAPGGVDPIVSYVRDVYADVLAHSRGEPLPEY